MHKKSMLLVFASLLFCSVPAMGAFIQSDGSDGVFSPAPGNYYYTLNIPEDGIFNFTSIYIPAGVTVKFNRNAANTPVYFAATGDVTIYGDIDVSATATNMVVNTPNNPKQTSGPGGFDGGVGADEGISATNGQGPGGGGAGYSAGGAGNATPGFTPVKYSSSAAGAGGSAVDFTQPLAGGSGGGGGYMVYLFGVPMKGGFGGGGGGALNISANGDVDLYGNILANGANGGTAQTNALATAGAGGAGAGGAVEIFGDAVSLYSGSLIQALGGYGGGLGTQTYSQDPAFFSSGADGGMGYAFFEGSSVLLDGDIQAVLVSAVPAPGAAWLLAWGLLGMFGAARRRAG